MSTRISNRNRNIDDNDNDIDEVSITTSSTSNTNSNDTNRKRTIDEVEIDTEKKLYKNDTLDYFITDQKTCRIKLTPGEQMKYESYDVLEKKRAIACICRLFIFKG